MPYKVLKDSELLLDPIKKYEKNGYIDVPEFLTDYEVKASYNSYINSCKLAGIKFYSPYAETIMGNKLDLQRVRKGENKYIIRELFHRLYSNMDIPPKTPMPRPMNEWFEKWEGPKREEFWPNCTDNMTGDQKWLVYILEKWLNMLEEDK